MIPMFSSRHIFHGLKLVAVILLFLPSISKAEYIESFDSKIIISPDSSFQVEERIEYVFDQPKHGIFRIIPTTHPDKSKQFYKERIIKIKVDSILMDGKSVPYKTNFANNEINIKIGDPDITITGTHFYEIKYTVLGGLSYSESGDVELYWNITGNEWPTSINNLTARVSSVENIFLAQKFCYRGFRGSSLSCESAVDETGEVIFSTVGLKTGEGMTIAQSLNPALVLTNELTRYRWGIIFLPVLMLGMLYGAWRLYKFEFKHKTGRTIVAQYEPYPGVKPMYTGLLFDGRLDTRDITAGIVYLAEQGYLKIRKTEEKILFLFEVDDYEVTILKTPDSSVSRFEHKMLELLFGGNLREGEMVSLNDLKKDQSKQTKNITILAELEGELAADLLKEGFFEKGSTTGPSLMWRILIAFIITLFLSFLLGSIFIILIGGAYVIWQTVRDQRRSRKGYEVLDHLKGFKLFLEMTDKERFDFHNAPEKSPEQFMKYLPYAIAFGVEEKWARAFEGIILPNPDWYDGGNLNSFSATSLTTSMNAFSTALASSSTTSASSGGGSSGGGGGGGGGGSW